MKYQKPVEPNSVPNPPIVTTSIEEQPTEMKGQERKNGSENVQQEIGGEEEKNNKSRAGLAIKKNFSFAY